MTVAISTETRWDETQPMEYHYCNTTSIEIQGHDIMI